MKVVVFNVGGALSSYVEINGKQLVIDLGSSSDFSPTNNFLLPLYEKKKQTKLNNCPYNNRYGIDRLFLSHPHDDHISDIINFDKNFYPELLTTPNSNYGNNEKDKVNWSKVTNPKEEYVQYLVDNMLPGRSPPLRSCSDDGIFLYFIPPGDCEDRKDLETSNYTNNLSLCVLLRDGKEQILFPGDLMKDGMEYVIKHNSSLRNKLADGISVLITPHHGLKSSFSTFLFQHMKNNKTYRLNIVSEKISTPDSNRIVDSRYSSTEYCQGENSFSAINNTVCQKKTSNGHIFIDTETSPVTFICEKDISEILKRF